MTAPGVCNRRHQPRRPGTDKSDGQHGQRQHHIGWVIGAGIDAFVTRNISARIEYPHHESGSEPYNPGLSDVTLDGHIDSVRAGVSYPF